MAGPRRARTPATATAADPGVTLELAALLPPASGGGGVAGRRARTATVETAAAGRGVITSLAAHDEKRRLHETKAAA